MYFTLLKGAGVSPRSYGFAAPTRFFHSTSVFPSFAISLQTAVDVIPHAEWVVGSARISGVQSSPARLQEMATTRTTIADDPPNHRKRPAASRARNDDVLKGFGGGRFGPLMNRRTSDRTPVVGMSGK